MTPAQDLSKSWSCRRCGVSARRIDGAAIPLPDGWATSAEGCFCLSCRRERVADQALDSAPSDSPREARAQLRRAALVEFEVRRTPEYSDGQIAKAARSSIAAVAKARQRLQIPAPAVRERSS
jgi:hypothetical protein